MTWHVGQNIEVFYPSQDRRYSEVYITRIIIITTVGELTRVTVISSSPALYQQQLSRSTPHILGMPKLSCHVNVPGCLNQCSQLKCVCARDDWSFSYPASFSDSLVRIQPTYPGMTIARSSQREVGNRPWSVTPGTISPETISPETKLFNSWYEYHNLYSKENQCHPDHAVRN